MVQIVENNNFNRMKKTIQTSANSSEDLTDMKCLVIEWALSCKIFEKSLEFNDMKGNSLTVIKIIGVICLEKYLFTCAVTEVTVAAKFKQAIIYEIAQVKFIPHFSNTA